ncbi:hypothetical protein Tco_1061399, partial [Tanacetum coccineum]
GLYKTVAMEGLQSGVEFYFDNGCVDESLRVFDIYGEKKKWNECYDNEDELQSFRHKARQQDKVYEEREESCWILHLRTGIFYPKGHEGVMNEVPDGAAIFASSYWLRNNDIIRALGVVTPALALAGVTTPPEGVGQRALVKIDPLRKCVSMNNLSQYEQPAPLVPELAHKEDVVVSADNGYASADDVVRHQPNGGRERKRG